MHGISFKPTIGLRRTVTAAAGAAVMLALVVPAGVAAAAGAFPASEKILPATTRGWVSISNAPEFRQRFDRSQYGQLLKDPVMKPFIENVRKQVETSGNRRFGRLGLTLDDLLDVAGGECALGAVESPTGRLATVVLLDTTGREAQARELVEKMNQRLVEQKGTKVVTNGPDAGGPLTVYQLPADEAGGKSAAAPQRVAFALVGNALVVGDDPALTAQVLGTLAQGRGDCIASLPGYEKVMARCQGQVPAAAAAVRWYIDPLTFAKAYQATNPPREKRKGPDYVAILARQGFDAIKGAGGMVVFDDGGHALRHHTMVYAPPLAGRKPFAADRFDLAARIIQFPDAEAIDPQVWVPGDVSGWTSLEWDLQNAFVSIETLVDDIVGEKGVYDDVIASVKEDPDGPQIDIEKDLVACLGTRMTLITDHAIPIDTDSERLVIAVQAIDPERVAATVAKSMSIDPDMAKIDVQGFVAWELIDRSSAIPKLEIETPGGAVVHADNEEDSNRRRGKIRDRDRDEKLLPHSVVTVANGHLLIASHRDILERVLATKGGVESLGSAADYTQVAAELSRLLPGKTAARSFSREEEVIRPAYEMLRQGSMPKSKSLTGQVLNGMLGDGKPGTVRAQRLDGSTLPEFELIRQYFGTVGLGMQSLEDGWYITGVSVPKGQQETEVARRPVTPAK
ncbi:MAG: hypothetical protein HQ464_14235 [Planctomycetes bacterium]|nr:hypothetical protein [Planctomycetota bacterium]